MDRRRHVMGRGRRTAIVVAVLGSFLAVSLAGNALAQSSSPSASPSSGKIVFRVGVLGDMVSTNPFKALYSEEYEMMFNAYDMLFNFSQTDLTPAPGLATGCNHSDDYKTWTCDIRSGVKWSDGEPVTAADIAFTYNFIVKNNEGTYTGELPPAASAKPTFSAPNATTFVWKTSVPTQNILNPPWVPILPEHIWAPLDGKSQTEIKAPPELPLVGSGPFVLTSWDKGSGWIMEANKDYWGGAPTIDEIDYQEFTNAEAMVQALKAGQIDFANDIPVTLFNSLSGNSEITQVKGSPSFFNDLAFNFGGQEKVDPTVDPTNDPILHDVRIRQAISQGIDRQAIVDKVWQGDASLGTVVTLPTSPWFYQPTNPELQAYNPDAANALLDQAGYTQKDSDGIRIDPATGDPIVLDIMTITDVTGSKDTGELIAEQLKQIGIGVHLDPVKGGAADTKWAEGDFDAYVWDWGGSPDPDFILSLFTTDQCLIYSDGCYSDPAYDKMYTHQKSIMDVADRKAYVDQMQQYIWDNMPLLALNYPNYLQAYRNDRFTGYVPQPTNGGNVIFAWGPYSYINLKPVSAAAGGTTSSSGAATTGFIVAAVAVVIGVIAYAIFSRRRRTGDEA
jgi:peptide/nickel transport system substrate-binding protein